MTTWILQLKNLALVILFCFPLVQRAEALNLKDDLMYGVFTGLGGTGVSEDIMTTAGDTLTNDRSEEPLVFGFSVETHINEKWTLALSHRRGVKMGPFRSGVGFTGLTVRRYFLRPSSYLPPKDSVNTATIQRWAPYIGLGGGIAIGSIKRDEVGGGAKGSGVFFGIDIGVDYPLYPKLILRPRLFTSATFMDDSATPAVLQELGIGCSFIFRI